MRFSPCFLDATSPLNQNHYRHYRASSPESMRRSTRTSALTPGPVYHGAGPDPPPPTAAKRSHGRVWCSGTGRPQAAATAGKHRQGLTCDQRVTYHRWAMDEMDPVFKALADPHRRHLLDRLHERDGQTLSELQGYLPLSRFGCMKHLRVLEEAGLVTSRKVGREKFHFLNPVPIQRAYDRWVEKYARPWTRTDLGAEVVSGGTRHGHGDKTGPRLPDLHPGAARTRLAGHHRPRHDPALLLRHAHRIRFQVRLALRLPRARWLDRCWTGRSSRAIPRTGW